MNRKYLVKRLGMMVFSLWIIATVLFLLFRLGPGGPTAMLSEQLSPELRRELMESWGLTDPLYVQYFRWWQAMFVGDLGHSFYYGSRVEDVIMRRLWNTLALMLPALLLSYSLGVYFGAHVAWIRGSVMERVELVIVLLLRATPVFWTGLVLLFIFSFQLGWFPLGGMQGIGGEQRSGLGLFLSLEFIHHLVLPVVALSVYFIGLPLLLTRSNMLDVLTQEYITTARSKGVSERRVMLKHAARNALLPVLTAFAVAIGFSVGGQVLIETVFSWPGLGKVLVDSAANNDYPLAQMAFLMLAALVITMNFVADMLYAYLDPRVGVGEGIEE